ncbi:sporulation-delaying protein SdpB family protein [Streptomyces sp. NPDC050617]|uniref:sporulation-delaying protein SdpB family protein n=1 Tax=Streptomyces sp. NPDC050617 TaxID=3154628 RepID=UPI00342F3808
MQLTAALNSLADRLAAHTERHDLRSRWFGIGRTVIAAAELSVLLLTPVKALLVPVLTIGEFPRCDSARAASALCIGGDTVGMEPRRWLLIAILVVAASGYRPRWTAIPLAWATYSVAVSISVPDGGESVAMIMCLLMIPIGLADNRTWHWQRPKSALAPSWRTLSLVAFLAIRVQIAYLYLDSAISKFGVADWANGTAEYYFLRDNMFGVSEPWDSLMLWLSKNPLIVVSMTWGALVIELAIGVCLLASRRWRKTGLIMDIVLHGSIILTMGLWSFGLVMIGSAIVCATPDRRSPAPTRAAEEGSPGLPAREDVAPPCAACGTDAPTASAAHSA